MAVPIHGSGTTTRTIHSAAFGGALPKFRDRSGETLQVRSEQQDTMSGNPVGESGGGSPLRQVTRVAFARPMPQAAHALPRRPVGGGPLLGDPGEPVSTGQRSLPIQIPIAGPILRVGVGSQGAVKVSMRSAIATPRQWERRAETWTLHDGVFIGIRCQ